MKVKPIMANHEFPEVQKSTWIFIWTLFAYIPDF